jgi:two-component system sensor histidine kinase BaeS
LTEDDVRVAFDRFALHDRYRGERKVGAGLGLALIAGLAARLGGQAAVGRAPEGGACFTVTLPSAPPAARDAMPGADSDRRFTSP